MFPITIIKAPGHGEPPPPVPKSSCYILPNGYEIDGVEHEKFRTETEAKIEELRSTVAKVCLDTIDAKLELKIAVKRAFLASEAERLATAEPLPPNGAYEEPLRRARERAATAPVHHDPAPAEEVRAAVTKLTALKYERLAMQGRKAPWK